MAYVINYTGDGGGKTLAALGLGLRAWGHGRRVIVVQFMKGREEIGEFLAVKKLSGFAIYQFGREGFVDLRDPSDEDKGLAEEGLGFAREALSERPDLMVLDEVNLAVSVGLLDGDDVIDLVKEAPEDTTIVLTGRYAPDGLKRVSDIVVRLEDVKSVPERDRRGPEKGFEF